MMNDGSSIINHRGLDEATREELQEQRFAWVNTNQLLHYVAVASQPVPHCNLPSLHEFIASSAAGRSFSEAATCLEQLWKEETEQVKKSGDKLRIVAQDGGGALEHFT